MRTVHSNTLSIENAKTIKYRVQIYSRECLPLTHLFEAAFQITPAKNVLLLLMLGSISQIDSLKVANPDSLLLHAHCKSSHRVLLLPSVSCTQGNLTWRGCLQDSATIWMTLNIQSLAIELLSWTEWIFIFTCLTLHPSLPLHLSPVLSYVFASLLFTSSIFHILISLWGVLSWIDLHVCNWRIHLQGTSYSLNYLENKDTRA